jgi:hypothetical protein
MIISNRVRWAENVALMIEKSLKILVRKHEGKRPLE